MDYSVIHLGGAKLIGIVDAALVTNIIASHPGPLVLVVSALDGTASALAAAAEGGPSAAIAGCSEPGRRAAARGAAQAHRRERLASLLYEKHLAFLVALAPEPGEMRRSCEMLAETRDELARLLGGLRLAAHRRERLLKLGERLLAICVAAAFSRVGRKAILVESEELGRALGEAEGAGGMESALPAIRAGLRGHSAAVIPEYYVRVSGRQAARVE